MKRPENCKTAEVLEKSLYIIYIKGIEIHIDLLKEIQQIISNKLLISLIPFLTISSRQKLYGHHPSIKKDFPINKSMLAFFRATVKHKLSETDTTHLFHLLYKHDDAIKISRTDLIRLYQIPIKRSQKAIIPYLATSSPTLEEQPLQKDSQLAIVSTILQEDVSIQSNLDERGIIYQNELLASTSHILYDTSDLPAPQALSLNKVYLTQDQLQNFFTASITPHIQTNEIGNIRALLVSDATDNVLLGFQLLEGMGIPNEIMPLVFAIHKQTPHKKLREAAKALLQTFGSEKVKEALSDRRPLYFTGSNKNDKKTLERLELYAEKTGLDSMWWLYYIHKRHNEKQAYLLERILDKPALLAEVLQDMTDPQGRLILYGSKHLNVFPPSIYQHQGIADLRIWDTLITELPVGISALKNLRCLQLSNCKNIKQLPPDLWEMEQLEELYLREVGIKSINPAIGQLKNLKKLTIEKCTKLTHLPDEIYHLPNLEFLSIKNIKLKKLPEALSQLPNLQTLKMWSLPLSELSTDFGLLPQLKELEICFFDKLTALPASFKQLQQLKKLDLVLNHPNVEFPISVYELKNLEELRLTLDKLEDFPDGIGKLQKLQKLRMTRYPFKRLPNDIGELKQLNSWKIIACRGNTLQELPPNLERLTQLKSLAVSSLTPPLVKQLKELFPFVKVY